jgi:hypothetical protein
MDGWISVYEEVPTAGQTVEIRAGNQPDASSGRYQGTCNVKVSPPLGEDWTFQGPTGETLYIVFWRRLQ